MKCWWLPPNCHGGGGVWQHEFNTRSGMWGSGIRIGQKCQCRKTTWTKERAKANDRAVDRIASDSNLNRM